MEKKIVYENLLVEIFAEEGIVASSICDCRDFIDCANSIDFGDLIDCGDCWFIDFSDFTDCSHSWQFEGLDWFE